MKRLAMIWDNIIPLAIMGGFLALWAIILIKGKGGT
jgi:hypothetical protein